MENLLRLGVPILKHITVVIICSLYAHRGDTNLLVSAFDQFDQLGTVQSGCQPTVIP